MLRKSVVAVGKTGPRDDERYGGASAADFEQRLDAWKRNYEVGEATSQSPIVRWL